MPTEAELIEERIRKTEELRKRGINPFPYKYNRTHTAVSAKALHPDLAPETKTTTEVAVAGRLIAIRRMGKATFGKIRDETGEIQVYFRADDMSDYELVKLVDRGDFIGVKGLLFATKTGELTVGAKVLTVLGKAMRPLPEKFHGLKEIEIRYRKRYLDLIMNDDVKEVFVMRTRIIQVIREFLTEKGFLEVETPVLQSLYGGTNATPFKTHLNTLKQDMYLRIAPELYLKRCVVGGMLKVFEIAKNFRNEDADTTHNPEFTMLEFYEAFVDYHAMMDTSEEMYKKIAQEIHGSLQFEVWGNKIDLEGKWPRLAMTDAVKHYLNLDVESMSLEELHAYITKEKLQFRGTANRGLFIFTIFDKLVAHKLINPVWIIDYPKEISPLAKPHRTKEGWVERFECYIGGKEIGDGWSEIVDAQEQRKRFSSEQAEMRAGNTEAHPMDEEFLEAMEYGMPTLGGIGIGIDRLTMFFTNRESIRDVILFPFMKQQGEKKQPE